MKLKGFKILTSFDCPFCEDKPVHVLKDEYGLLHELPMCHEFESMSPDRFLEAANKRRMN